MPWTLYRYILKDLLKVLAISTTVLMVVISVAAAIKPLSDGLLGPAGLVKFVLYSLPTMLGFALPFAAAFSSTMVFCRLGADNELTACRAGGMSYRAILLPVFFLGLLLTLSLFYLSNWIVPTFYLMAEQQLEHDLTKMLVSQVRKRQPVSFGNIVLYADWADDTHAPPVVLGPDKLPADLQPERLVMLQGVAVARLDDQSQLRTDVTAQRADVYLYRVGGQTWATMQLVNMVIYDVERGLVSSGRQDLPPVRLPNPFKDRLHFLGWPQLQQLGEHPERFDDVAGRKQVLVDAMGNGQLVALMESSLAADDGKGVLTLRGEDEKYTVSAPKVERMPGGLSLSSTPATPIHVEIFIEGAPTRKLDAKSGKLNVEPGEIDAEPQVKATFRGVTVYDPSSKNRPIERKSDVLPRGHWPESVTTTLDGRSAAQLLDMVASDPDATPTVVTAATQLRDSISLLARKIVARLHGRAASAVDCMLVLLLGAVLSLVLRGSMPLVVYFWGFVLATIAVVIARSGENVASETAQHLAAGVGVIWSGNILLAATIGWLYWKLSRT